LIELILHKFYAASISIGLDGTMLVASTKDRLLVWGMAFCLIAALSLISFLIWRRPDTRRISIVVFIMSLNIPVFIMPSAKHEHIHITRDQISIDTGKWYRPSTTIVALRGLQRLSRDSSDYMISNIIGDAYVTWHFERQDGSVQKLVLNDFFSAHSMTIAHYIRDRGYQVEWLQISK
jgi:hypothetical protein